MFADLVTNMHCTYVYVLYVGDAHILLIIIAMNSWDRYKIIALHKISHSINHLVE